MAYTLNEIFGSIAIIVSCGAAVLLVKLLLNNTMQQEKFFNSLGKCFEQLQDASRKLDTLTTILDRRFASMEDNRKQSDPLLINTLQRFDKVSQEIKDRLDDLLDAEFPEAAAEMVVQEIAKLQNNLEEMSSQLRENNDLSADENADLVAMRKRIESYQSMVMKARSDAKQSEAQMAELREEIERLRLAGLEATVNTGTTQQSEMQTQLQTLTQEKKTLEDKIAAMHDEMHRNNIEKNFIEERFIQLT